MNKVKQWFLRFFKIRTLEQVIKESERIIRSGERLKKGDYIIIRGGFAPGFYVEGIKTDISGINYYQLIPDDYRADLSGWKCDEQGCYCILEEYVHNLLIFVER